MLSFTKLTAEVEKIVTRMVFESYGLEKYYESHQKAVTHFCRTNRYMGTTRNHEKELAIPAHTDKAILGIVHQNEVNGMEVQAKDGEWFTVELKLSSYLVMVDDAAMAWSNNRMRPAHHRINMSRSEPRYSIIQFSFVEGKMIETPKELVDEDHPLQFKPFDHLKFLEFSKGKHEPPIFY